MCRIALPSAAACLIGSHILPVFQVFIDTYIILYLDLQLHELSVIFMEYTNFDVLG